MKHIKGLDAVRTFAIISIVLYHLRSDLFPGGFLGVNGFFVLMGFLMMYGLSDNFHALTYYGKRIRRLYPSLLLTLIFVLVLMLCTGSFTSKSIGEVASILLGYNNFYQIAQNASYFTRITNASPMTHLWYLGLVMQYVVLWPLYILIVGRVCTMACNRIQTYRRVTRRRSLLIMVAVLPALVSAIMMAALYRTGSDPSRIYYGPDTRAFAILAGIAIGAAFKMPTYQMKRAMKDTDQKKSWLGIFAAAGILCVLAWFNLLANGTNASTYRFFMQASTVLYGALLWLILMHQATLGRILESKPLGYIGSISYEIYLVMYPCIWLSGRLCGDTISVRYMISAVILIILSALAIHYVVQALANMKTYAYQDTSKIWLIRSRYALLLAACLLLSIGQSVHTPSDSVYASDEKELESSIEKGEEMVKTQNQAASANSNASSVSSAAKAEQAASANKDNVAAKQSAAASSEAPTASATQSKSTGSASNNSSTANTAGQNASSQATTSQQTATNTSSSVTAIGDSVMLGAAPALMQDIGQIHVDATVGRQVGAAADILNQLRREGSLGQIVIIHLGTNGPGRESDFLNDIDACGGRHIYWITAHGVSWDAQTNHNIEAAAAQRSNVTVVDWNSYANGHSDWFYQDGIHLKPAGQQAYAAFVKTSCGL